MGKNHPTTTELRGIGFDLHDGLADAILVGGRKLSVVSNSYGKFGRSLGLDRIDPHLDYRRSMGDHE